MIWADAHTHLIFNYDPAIFACFSGFFLVLLHILPVLGGVLRVGVFRLRFTKHWGMEPWWILLSLFLLLYSCFVYFVCSSLLVYDGL